MSKYKKLLHVIYKCDYHIVWVPTYRFGILKGKLAVKLFKSYPKIKQKPYWGNHSWARGYFVNTVEIEEDVIKRYVKHQEKEEKLKEEQQHKFDF